MPNRRIMTQIAAAAAALDINWRGPSFHSADVTKVAGSRSASAKKKRKAQRAARKVTRRARRAK